MKQETLEKLVELRAYIQRTRAGNEEIAAILYSLITILIEDEMYYDPGYKTYIRNP